MALLAAAGLLATLSASVSADENNIGSEAARALQPTEVVAEIPEAYNIPFPLQWGGGSLYQLKGRLATMGCMANNIWVYDNDERWNGRWNFYNQYQVPRTLTAIQSFTLIYGEFIPAGTLWADCYRICEFQYIDDIQGKECETFKYTQEQNFFNVPPYPIDSTALCTSDFNLIIQEKILPILPLHPDTCVVRQSHTRVQGYYLNFFATYDEAYPHGLPIIVIYAPEYIYTSPNSFYQNSQQTNNERIMTTEIHELCHISQQWQVAQALRPDIPLTAYPNSLWHETPAGKEFIALVEFRNINRTWVLPQNSIYKNIYSIDPLELSAELCMMYIIENIGIENRYKNWIWKNNRFVQQPSPNFNINTYLTPEIREWLETYMILPEITE